MACSSEATINLNFIFHEALALVREMESIEGIACALNEHGHRTLEVRITIEVQGSATTSRISTSSHFLARGHQLPAGRALHGADQGCTEPPEVRGLRSSCW